MVFLRLDVFIARLSKNAQIIKSIRYIQAIRRLLFFNFQGPQMEFFCMSAITARPCGQALQIQAARNFELIPDCALIMRASSPVPHQIGGSAAQYFSRLENLSINHIRVLQFLRSSQRISSL